jgi:hypothetical protein
MTKNTNPGKRRAREIQRATGKPYTACLRIALDEIEAKLQAKAAEERSEDQQASATP